MFVCPTCSNFIREEHACCPFCCQRPRLTGGTAVVLGLVVGFGTMACDEKVPEGDEDSSDTTAMGSESTADPETSSSESSDTSAATSSSETPGTEVTSGEQTSSGSTTSDTSETAATTDTDTGGETSPEDTGNDEVGATDGDSTTSTETTDSETQVDTGDSLDDWGDDVTITEYASGETYTYGKEDDRVPGVGERSVDRTGGSRSRAGE